MKIGLRWAVEQNHASNNFFLSEMDGIVPLMIVVGSL